MIQVTDQFVELMDKEIVLVTRDNVTIKTLKGDSHSAKSLYSRT